MPSFHVVTDSSARFGHPRFLQQYPVTVVPYQVDLAGKRFREEEDLTPEEMLSLVKSQSTPPRLIAPSVEELSVLYANLSRSYDGIISIHSSRELSDSWQNARQAALQAGDSCAIAVIDSGTLCAGQGMLVRLAGQGVLDELDFESIVKKVRGAVDRIYCAYYVESLDYLHKNHMMSEAHAILGTMLKIKPFLSIEEGQFFITEKVRSRSQAIERMVEFLKEFEDLEDAMIVQNRVRITEQARALQDRLSVEFPGKHFPYTIYSAMLAVLLGADATGVVVLESEIEGLNDGF